MANITVWNNEEVLANLTGQLSEKSKRIYRHDAKVFAVWMIENGLTGFRATLTACASKTGR